MRDERQQTNTRGPHFSLEHVFMLIKRRYIIGLEDENSRREWETLWRLQMFLDEVKRPDKDPVLIALEKRDDAEFLSSPPPPLLSSQIMQGHIT